MKIIYDIQYAIESKLPAGEHSTLWNMILEVIFDNMNNSPTRLIGMSPSHAMTLEKVISKPSIKPKRPVGENEEQMRGALGKRGSELFLKFKIF